MGVTGLWKLIEPCGKPVPVETLESKILAIDISIWLHQVVKGFQDNKGSALPYAHLLGLFHRLCKLLYYRVKPVFVFDGCVPQLKRDTIARRQLQRNKLNSEADRIQALLLQSLAKEKVVQQALGVNAAELLLKSPNKRASNTVTRSEDAVDDIFKLPEMPAIAVGPSTRSTKDEDDSDLNSSALSATTSEDSSFDESNPRNYYNANLQAIDVRSNHFKALPADVRHDILVDIKETRKQSSWGRLHELPAKSDDFSTFQMKRLLKRRAVQESIEEAEQEMGGHSLTYSELQNLFTEEGIVESSALDKGSKQISSDENTRYLLVRDLKKKLTAIEENPLQLAENKNVDSEEKPCSSKHAISSEKSTNAKADILGEEYDMDLELAIALSLEQSTVYSAKDYDYDSDENLKLNRDQRKQLKNAAVGPARAFMLEYAGMNDDELHGIMEKTQNIGDDDLTINEFFKETEVAGSPHDELRLHVTDSETNSDIEFVKEINKNEPTPNTSSPKSIKIDSSDADSDFEEVPDKSKEQFKITTDEIACVKKNLEVVVDLTKDFTPQEDIFSDIFEKNKNYLLDQKFSTESVSVLKSNNLFNTNTDKAEKIKPNVMAVLDELKKQANDIVKIKLDDIKIDSSIIELSDDDTSELLKIKNKNMLLKTPVKSKLTSEVIELPDQEVITKNIDLNSPLLKTPTKTASISDYFQTDYVIKRTPEQAKTEENTPKVKSPFFINKTPKSNRKRALISDTSSASPLKKSSKATKSLFSGNESTDDLEPIELTATATSVPAAEAATSVPAAEDVLNEAANILKDQKSTDELREMATDIAKEKRDLEKERNRQDRMGMSISQRMNSDCQELLRLFGIPYIVAPMEAEAQCAFLDAMELTNGTITDDSDIWLFGGRTVYKNFFAQNKHVLEFRADEIERSFNCDRLKFIQLACLVGSDYTTGIHGIGAVTAMEILATFNPKKEQSDPKDATISTIMTALSKFRDWWITSKTTVTPPSNSTRLALRKKLKNIDLYEGFPNMAVIDAYLSPKVDENKETFSWGFPDIESIREFSRKTFGWTTSKTDDILMPVIKKINEKKSQATIKNYFNVKSALSARNLKVSKRVQSAIDKMSGKIEEIEKPKTKKATQKPRKVSTKRIKNGNELSVKQDETDSMNAGSSCNSSAAAGSSCNRAKKARIPNTKQIIPQREKDLEQMRKNKETAAKILKKTKKAT